VIYSTPFKFRAPTPRTAMAQSFDGKRQFGRSQYILTLKVYARLTVSFWLNWTGYSDDGRLAAEYSANYNWHGGTFFFDPNSSLLGRGHFGVGVNTRSWWPARTVAGFVRPAARVWNHILAQFDLTQAGAAQIPAVYVNGVSQTLTYAATAGVPTHFSNQALYLMTRGGTDLFGAGAMSDFAIFRDLLSGAQAVALANGTDPRLIATGATDLLYYWTLSVLRPEPNWGWNTNALLTATDAAVPAPSQVLAKNRRPLLTAEVAGTAMSAVGSR
jgi:Concanavalin A-like lectin/glucanases superfamily